LYKVQERTREVPLSEQEITEAELKAAEERKKKEESGEKIEEPIEPVARTKKETYKEKELQQINSSKPIWLRDPKEITESEYESYYKTLTNNLDTPTAYNHFNSEGEINYKSII